MRYEGAIYRPPSEGRSLIVQATIGCSHNKCTFCDMYKEKKFRMRNLTEVIEDLRWARNNYKYIEKIFIADGDALILPTDRLITILDEIKVLFPECKRVTIYASPKSILIKSKEDLELLKAKGLDMVYLGVESGDDYILARVNKGVTSADMIEAGKKVKKAGLRISCTLISGLGGSENWMQHAQNSAKVINEINPDFLGLLTLMTPEGTKILEEVQKGTLTLLTPKEVMVETHELVKGLELSDCVFRSNHASNYAPLAAVLGQEKERLMMEIEKYMGGEESFRPEYFRGL